MGHCSQEQVSVRATCSQYTCHVCGDVWDAHWGLACGLWHGLPEAMHESLAMSVL